MRFSVWPLNQQPAAELLAVCRHAEATGWDGVWMADHVMPGGPPWRAPVLECWTTVAAVAATVPRVRVGTLVTSVTYRNPALVAKMAATVAALCDGRFVLGVGAGWQSNEHDAYGWPFPPPAVRLAQLDEACRLIRPLLAGQVVSHDGSYFRTREAVVSPTPPAPVPLLVGVKGDRALGIAARHADEWNAWGTPEQVRRRNLLLDEACRRAGRDPATLHRSAQALLLPARGAPARWTAAGLPMLPVDRAELQDTVSAYAAAGLDELVVPDFALGELADKLVELDRFVELVADFR